jgi:hypothetical protein
MSTELGPEPVRLRVRIAASALVLLVLAGLVEAGLALLPRIANDRLLRGMLYFPPEVTRAQYERYLTVRDPVAGWPAVDRRTGNPGRPIPRAGPANPDSGEWCVTLYGDSFTLAAEVLDADAWGNLLARRLGCSVGNFGVGGYGTDQALLRFMQNTADRAPVTIVGIFADNLLRNVNQYRYFLTGGELLGLKPRFMLENGALKLVPIPDLTYEQFVKALAEPRDAWPHELFLPGSRHGPVPWSFPYIGSFFNLVRSPHVTNYLQGRPSWIDFYDPEHESKALLTTVAIIEEFRRRAAAPGKTVVAVLFPTEASYRLTRRTGTSALGPLTKEIEARGIPVLDLTMDFARHLGERSFCELLTHPAACVGHYDAEGNRVVAEAVRAFLATGLTGVIQD